VEDLVDEVVVRGDLAGHHRLAEPPRRVDRDLRAVPVGGVQRERHPGGLGVDHLLDPHRHRDHVVVVAGLVAVGDGPVGEDRRPAPLDVLEHRVGAADPQVGVLLAGEAGVGQVLGGGRRADRDRDVVGLAVLAQRP
jgi:hypothetical protein